MKTITLSSTEMIKTPSIFRMFKHRYETESDKTIIAMVFADVYKLKYTVARDVLSGKIPVTIDDKAETVTFTIA